MTVLLRAKYENGLFKPLAPVTEGAAEGQEVQIVVDTGQRSDIVDLALRFTRAVRCGCG